GKRILKHFLVLPVDLYDVRNPACLGQAHRRVQFADPEVEAEYGVVFHAAVITDMIVAVVGVAVGQLVAVFVVGDHHATFARRGAMDKVERIRHAAADKPDRCAFLARAAGLTGVLIKNEVVLPANRGDFIHSSHAAAHMHEQHRLRTGCYGGTHALRAETKGLVDLGKYRERAAEQHGLNSGDVGEWRHDHLVTSADPGGRQRTGNGRGTA